MLTQKSEVVPSVFFPNERVRFVAHDKREPELERREERRGEETTAGAEHV